MPVPNRTFRLLSVESGSTLRITLHGELDRATIITLAQELRECERRAMSVVVLDLSDLEFLDGLAFRVLLDFARRLRRHGRHLSLVNPSREVRRILAVSAIVHEADVLDEWLEGAKPSP